MSEDNWHMLNGDDLYMMSEAHRHMLNGDHRYDDLNTTVRTVFTKTYTSTKFQVLNSNSYSNPLRLRILCCVTCIINEIKSRILVKSDTYYSI